MILVTGATGFIGGHLVERLANDGERVRALVRRGSDAAKLEKSGVECVRGDLTDAASLEKAVRGCRLVHHVGGLTSMKRTTGASCHAVNAVGTRLLAEAALKAGVERFVYVSTCGVYGRVTDPPIDEACPTRPNTHYRLSKLLGERAVSELHRNMGLPAVVARIGTVIGPGSFSWFGFFKAIAERRFRMLGNGRNRVHPGWCSDIVDGIVRCGKHPGIEGKIYNFAGPAPLALGRFVEIIGEETGAAIPERPSPAWPFRLYAQACDSVFRLARREMPASRRYDLFLSDAAYSILNAERDLGYRPTVSGEEAVRRLAAWYFEQGYLTRSARAGGA